MLLAPSSATISGPKPVLPPSHPPVLPHSHRRGVPATLLLVLSLALSLTLGLAPRTMANSDAAEKLLTPFPKPDAGMRRFVICLPPKSDEYSFRVELQVGKTVRTDPHNRYFFGGRLERETVQGWGYDFVILRQLGPMAGTRMGVDPDAPKVDRFVTIGGEPELQRYNSRLPLVVYVPEEVEVRYRIWSASDEVTTAKEG